MSLDCSLNSSLTPSLSNDQDQLDNINTLPKEFHPTSIRDNLELQQAITSLLDTRSRKGYTLLRNSTAYLISDLLSTIQPSNYGWSVVLYDNQFTEESGYPHWSVHFPLPPSLPLFFAPLHSRFFRTQTKLSAAQCNKAHSQTKSKCKAPPTHQTHTGSITKENCGSTPSN